MLTDKQRTLLAQATERAERRDFAGAAEILERLIRKNPGQTELLYHLAVARMRQGRYREAIRTLEKMHRIAPGQVSGYLQLAYCHRHQGALTRAMKAADKALAARRDHPQALTIKAELLHMAGDYQRGYDLLKPHFAQRSPRLVLEFARLARHLGHTDQARATLEALIAPDDLPRDMRCTALFELAAVYDTLGEYERAWSSCVAANDLQSVRFDPDAHEAMIDRVIAAWTAQGVAALPRAQIETEVPVFIVGMPRSGTSLVEQILASHPAVYGAGELPDIFKIVGGLQPHSGPAPAHIDDLSVLTQGAVDRSARTYLKSVTARSRSARRIADKQVFNFLYLGAIRMMFPNARVIHCTRDPRDVAVSCFFQSFRGLVYFANRLDHIGVFYAAYRRLMDHWGSVLEGPLLEVSYEALTADQETVSRQLIEFVGLEWDDACLRFHENTRVVHTATMDQVRRPLYRSSVARWRHYEKYLEPISAVLS